MNDPRLSVADTVEDILDDLELSKWIHKERPTRPEGTRDSYLERDFRFIRQFRPPASLG
jgi:hypothetical protein